MLVTSALAAAARRPVTARDAHRLLPVVAGLSLQKPCPLLPRDGDLLGRRFRGDQVVFFHYVAAVEAAVQQHPQARRYRVAVKGNRIEVYEQVGPDYNALVSELHIPGLSRPGLAEELRALEERHAHYTPVLRFTLLDPKLRLFSVERMCYLGSIDGWLELGRTGPVAKLARALIPTLGTDQFYELW